jgi:predicted NBD/HSP70 family sugar kinase/biotin operon repressor
MKSKGDEKIRPNRRLVTAKPQTVRHLNRAAVLGLIRQYQPLSRADLARYTGIHRSNISIIVEDLQKRGLLREERAKTGGRGRTPTLISLERGSFGVLGVNLRRLRTTVSLASLDGHVESSFTFETPKTPEEFVETLREACKTVTQNFDQPASSRIVSQMVISLPGIVNRQSDGASTIWTPGLPKYSGCDLATMIKKAIGIPCLISNNAGLAATAVLRSGEKQNEDVNDFVLLVIGDVGVGSGVVIQHNLYSGYDAAYAGEVGHTVIDPKGPLCNCGRRGCLQLYICDSATWARYNARLDFSAARFAEFMDEVNAGSPKALAALSQTVEYLSIGISNIALTLNPEKIVLAGALTRVWPTLEKQLKSAFALPHQHTLIQRVDSPLDTLFLKGAIERALDVVLTSTSSRASK